MNKVIYIKMPNYSSGKVYVIKSLEEDSLQYIGSTVQPRLCQRMQKHVWDYKMWMTDARTRTSSICIFEKYGIDNCHITLLEAVDAKTKDELRMREQFYIDSMDCVNKQRAHVTPEMIKEQHRLWLNENKDQTSKHAKKYYKENKEEICAAVNQYRLKNIDIIKVRKKRYCDLNTDKIKQHKAEFKTANKHKFECHVCKYFIHCRSKMDRHKAGINHKERMHKSTIHWRNVVRSEGLCQL